MVCAFFFGVIKNAVTLKKLLFVQFYEFSFDIGRSHIKLRDGMIGQYE